MPAPIRDTHWSTRFFHDTYEFPAHKTPLDSHEVPESHEFLDWCTDTGILYFVSFFLQGALVLLTMFFPWAYLMGAPDTSDFYDTTVKAIFLGFGVAWPSMAFFGLFMRPMHSYFIILSVLSLLQISLATVAFCASVNETFLWPIWIGIILQLCLHVAIFLNTVQWYSRRFLGLTIPREARSARPLIGDGNLELEDRYSDGELGLAYRDQLEESTERTASPADDSIDTTCSLGLDRDRGPQTAEETEEVQSLLHDSTSSRPALASGHDCSEAYEPKSASDPAQGGEQHTESSEQELHFGSLSFKPHFKWQSKVPEYKSRGFASRVLWFGIPYIVFTIPVAHLQYRDCGELVKL
ncbi:hypothetical protein LTR37_006520 [Vermiconidia calcicola]|uniref:Uncharacterized protein n=1 Tax=Vermiconidia calcicola TaxID=1690605 RepID=A0ACC3NGV1_9PEZI|nr:hypothetical protein LTR37_006520 [Vermiconidia calcicola]